MSRLGCRMSGWLSLASLVWLVLAGALVGCGSSPAPATIAASAGSDPQQRRAVDAVRAIVKQAYSDLRRGDTDSLTTLMAASAFAVGPTGAMYAGRTQAVVALSKVFPRRKHKLRSRELRVVSSPGARAAWASDALDIDGVPYRATMVLVDEGGLWTVTAVQLIADAPVAAAASGGDEIAPGAGEIVALFREAVAEPPLFLEHFAETSDASVLAGQRDDAHGFKSIRKLWKKRLTKTEIELQGGLRAAVVPDGTLGWVAAAIALGEDGKPATNQRCFLVYERSGGEWRLISALGPLAARR